MACKHVAYFKVLTLFMALQYASLGSMAVLTLKRNDVVVELWQRQICCRHKL